MRANEKKGMEAGMVAHTCILSTLAEGGCGNLSLHFSVLSLAPELWTRGRLEVENYRVQ